ncbi:WYL domain-containing protein [Thalassotalea euphylliae]|uniref:WYL domain-containing protein n=1 Tax=Thalassotalea euphylliae TaxID=1655234 RepID=A0A3E0TLD8_9GAMM|nr:WYL domain-containing protein [Thalassotalea euphylliae]REL25364.1 WYL domain-containing protein [Thalassotalea euphylliae]
MDVSQYPYAQRQRLAFIDFCLQYFGQIARADLINHFKVGMASGTRDFALYKELVPDNLHLVHQTKLYYRTEQFKPLFNHQGEAVLTGLCRGFGDGIAAINQPSEVCFEAVRLIQPDSEIIAALMRAITHQQAVKCRYVSLSSGEQGRVIVPHSIVNNGHRWHVRAFDRKSASFRDFSCTRFVEAKVLAVEAKQDELCQADREWSTILTLTLKPHPKVTQPRAIEMDYHMVEGSLTLEVRAALVGYLLQQWQVDCSPNHHLDPSQHPLCLTNSEVLTSHDNAILAPGYSQPESLLDNAIDRPAQRIDNTKETHHGKF